MFEIMFGLFWTGFSLFVSFVFFGDFFISGEFDSFMVMPAILLSIFVIIGLAILIKGIKKVSANVKTSKNGEECYGILTNISKTGNSVNGVRELKGHFYVYLVSTNQVVTVEEAIGFNPFKYQVNNYVKVKYYNGDINVLEIVSADIVPSDARKALEKLMPSSEKFIIIDGNTYKKID